MDLFNVIDWNFCFARIWREYGNKSSILILTFVEPGCIRGVTGSACTGWNLNQENVKSTEKHSAIRLLHVTRREKYSASIPPGPMWFMRYFIGSQLLCQVCIIIIIISSSSIIITVISLIIVRDEGQVLFQLWQSPVLMYCNLFPGTWLVEGDLSLFHTLSV